MSNPELLKQIEDLKQQVQDLNDQLNKSKGRVVRKKIDVMSSEVVDSNPYRYDNIQNLNIKIKIKF